MRGNRMSDNLFVLMIVLLCMSTCGKPDLWDGATNYLMNINCESTKIDK